MIHDKVDKVDKVIFAFWCAVVLLFVAEFCYFSDWQLV
jgi:hypothetical protein